MRRTTSRLLLAALAGVTGSALAQEGPSFNVSGFGTAALTMTDTDQAEYVRPNQLNGVKKDPRTGVDSNFGIQGTMKWNDTLSFTAQGLVRKFATDVYSADMVWAFAKFKVNEDFNIRVGRIAIPVYMISDFRNVGFANTMIRPPAEVYRQVNGGSLDGADILYQHSFGDTTVTAQFGYGHSNTANAGGSRISFDPVTATHILIENGPYTLRFGRATAKFTIRDNTALDGLVKALRGAGLANIAQQIDANGVDGTFTSVGGIADYGSWLFQGEYAKRKTDTRAVMDTTSWYLMGAYRYGKFTPYYYHGDIKQDSIRTMPGMPTTGPLAPLTAGVNAVIKAALQTTNAVGLRWDFYKSAALKVQMDRVSPRDGPGAFVKPTPTFTGPVNVYAAGIDFVF